MCKLTHMKYEDLGLAYLLHRAHRHADLNKLVQLKRMANTLFRYKSIFKAISSLTGVSFYVLCLNFILPMPISRFLETSGDKRIFLVTWN